MRIYNLDKLLRKYSLIFIALSSTLIIYTTKSIGLQITVFSFYVMCILSLNNFDFYNPIVLFSSVFLLYSISYPLLFLMGEAELNIDVTPELIQIETLALNSFLLGARKSFMFVTKLPINKKVTIRKSSKIFTLLSSVFLVVSAIIIRGSGASHKNELYLIDSRLISLSLTFVLLYIANYLFIQLKFIQINGKLSRKSFIYSFLIIAILTAYTGERDFILRFALINFLLYFKFENRSKVNIKIIVIIFLLALLPITLSKYKYYFMSGVVNDSTNNYIIKFIKSDFQSASKNLQIILNNKLKLKSIFRGKTILHSLLRAFNLNKLFKLEMISSNTYFNNNYFKAGRSGQGFTLVGDAYINFGIIGIVILFTFIGSIVSILYKKSNKYITLTSVYVLHMINFLYAIRGDFATYFSGLTKQSFALVIILVIIDRVLVKENNHERDSKTRI